MFTKYWSCCYCFLKLLVRFKIFMNTGFFYFFPLKILIIYLFFKLRFFLLLTKFLKIWKDIELGISCMSVEMVFPLAFWFCIFTYINFKL